MKILLLRLRYFATLALGMIGLLSLNIAQAAIAGTVSLVMIIYGAFQMVMGSYEQNVKEGKQTITYALIGLVISASSWFIIKFVFTSFV